MDLSRFFAKSDLVPVIVQNVDTKDVLMLGYSNAEALKLTIDTGTAWFWSRSRQKLWNKGETSGNMIDVLRIVGDCDSDTLIYFGRPHGPTCHTGEVSCFFDCVWSVSDE